MVFGAVPAALVTKGDAKVKKSIARVVFSVINPVAVLAAEQVKPPIQGGIPPEADVEQSACA
jgi:hypothetical protein